MSCDKRVMQQCIFVVDTFIYSIFTLMPILTIIHAYPNYPAICRAEMIN